jgi:hypothetical protein
MTLLQAVKFKPGVATGHSQNIHPNYIDDHIPVLPALNEMRISLVLLLLRISSKLASRLSLLIDPSSVQNTPVRTTAPNIATNILTSNMLNALGLQEWLDQIQHARELAENNGLLLVVSLIYFPEKL